jgi:hypothetical protein
LNFLAGYFRDFGYNFIASTIEYDYAPARPETKHIARVMGFRSMQNEVVGIPFFRGDVKAMHFSWSS